MSIEVTAELHAAVWIWFRANAALPTLEHLAELAGVSRPAVYRRYRTVPAVILGALIETGAAVEMPKTEDLLHDLSIYFSAIVDLLGTESPVLYALRAVLAGALTDPQFAPDFKAFLIVRREPVRKRLGDGLPAATSNEVEFVLDQLFGFVLYRVLIRQESVTKQAVCQVVKSIIFSALRENVRAQ